MASACSNYLVSAGTTTVLGGAGSGDKARPVQWKHPRTKSPNTNKIAIIVIKT